MISFLLVSLLGASCMQATPIRWRRQNGSVGFQPKNAEDWEQVVDIDSNCGLNKPEITAALNEAYTLAETAKNFTADDYFFSLFFVPQDVTLVQKLFSTIAESASSNSKQYKISCLSAYATACGSNTTIAMTDRASTNGTLPEIRLCPPALHLTPSPTHDQQTLGHIILAQLTYFDAYARQAGLPVDSLNQTSVNNGTSETSFSTDIPSAGTYDVWAQNLLDENNVGKTYRDYAPVSYPPNLDNVFAAAAGCLKARWDAYNKARNGFSTDQTLNKPPIETLKNAGSYPSFAMLFSDGKNAGQSSQAQLRNAAFAMANAGKC